MVIMCVIGVNRSAKHVILFELKAWKHAYCLTSKLITSYDLACMHT